MADKIIIECESHPYYVQYLCHIIWEKAIDKKKIVNKDVIDSRGTLLLREASTFEATWDLLSVKQKQVLIALAETDKQEKIFSTEFLSKYRLGSASSVQRTVSSLIEKDLIDRTDRIYSIIDVINSK